MGVERLFAALCNIPESAVSEFACLIREDERTKIGEELLASGADDYREWPEAIKKICFRRIASDDEP